MAWLRLDDRVRTHPKIVTAGPAAAWFWFCGICYCREHLTDGFIPNGMLASLAPGVTSSKTLAGKLVAAGLWHQRDAGYEVHDFLDWNPSRAEVQEARDADKERKRKNFQTENSRKDNRKDNGIQAEPSRDRAGARGSGLGSGLDAGVQSSEESARETTLHRVDDGFEAFWAEYPRKVGKEAARKIWRKLKPSKELADQIIVAIQEQKLSPQWLKDGGQFIPNPATWLNQGRWQDEPQDGPNFSEKTTNSLRAIYGTHN